jgi:hypothetical protein
VNGVRHGTREFHRWLFGRLVSFPPQIRTVISLLVGLLALLALVVINLAIGVVAAARWGFGDRQGVVGDGLYGDLSTTFNLLFVLVVLLAVSLAVSRLVRTAPGFVTLATGLVSAAAFVLALGATIATGVAIPILFLQQSPPGAAGDLPLLPSLLGLRLVDRFNALVELGTLALVLATLVVVGLASVGRFVLVWWRSVPGDERPGLTVFAVLVFAALVSGLALELGALTLTDWGRAAGAGVAGRGIVWMLLVASSLIVRRVIVQYVGDTAAYVQPHALDRFQDLREEIKTAVYEGARAIYRAGNEHGFMYQSVVVAGHSLGSVIAYDVLNRLFNEDEIAGEKSPAHLSVAARTALFLTFGSPLDKTAFAFGAQREQTATRYALAATVQPMIRMRSPEQRPPWVNVYSAWDPISGALNFYDPPPGKGGDADPRAVANRSDAGARTLFLAHLEYWDGTLVYSTLLDALDAR